MPRTTINVIFSGRDNGLVNLFTRINQAVTSLDANLNKLEGTLSRVDGRFKSMKSNSGFLTSLGNGGSAKQTGTSIQSLGLRNFQQGVSSAGSFITSALSRTASFTSSVFRGVTSTISGAVGSAYKNVSNMIAFVDKAIMTFGNSIRQIAQGVQSFGIAFSIFVSAPLAGILKSIVTESVNFDDALIGVQKTTGATKSQIKELGEELTQISLELPNTRQELAQYAEGWGALGVGIESASDAARLSGLAKWTAQLVMSAEDLTAADVVEKLGKAIVLYYSDINEFDKVKEKIGSVILALEAVNNVGAGDILSTFQRMAPIAEQMGIDIVQALTMSASVASGVASSERAGTELAAALQKITINLDKTSAATGISQAKLTEMMETDANGFFLSLAYSIGQMGGSVAQQTALYEQFGVTGGKAVAALISSWENLEKNIKVADKAFLEGTRMQLEFQQSLESTKVQLGILRNNITYAGSAIGDALLPYITKFVTIAVPAIQMLTNWFKGLDERIKIQVLAWGALLAIAGPVVVFFSSLLFMIGLTISGLSSLFGVVGMVAQGLFGFIGALIGFLSPINLLVAAIAGIAIYSVYIAKDLLMAESVVQSYVSRAYDWGYNLISSFAEGIQSAASAAYNAVMSVINAFIGLIQAFSPPKQGPLKDIQKWGQGTIEAYADGITRGAGAVRNAALGVTQSLKQMLEGFSPETVSMFSGAFNAIKGTISAVAAQLGITSGDTNRKIEEAANSVALFIQNLQSGIPDNLQEISGFLGGLTGDFELLITMQNKYAEGETRLRQIEKALKGINSETDQMIGKVVMQTNLTADQQSAMIRRIKLEQAAKEVALNNEQASIQAEQDALKSDIDKKQEIIDILTGLIFPNETTSELGDVNKKPDKENDIASIDFQKFDEAGTALDKVAEKFEKTSESAKTFTEKLGDAKAMIEGFVAAIRGDDKESYGEMPEAFWAGWEKGADIREKVLDFMGKFDAIYQKIKTAKGIIDDAFTQYLLGYGEAQGGGKLDWDKIAFMDGLAVSMFILGFVAGVAAKMIEDFVKQLLETDLSENSSIGIIITRIKDAINAFTNGIRRFTKGVDWTILVDALESIGVAIGGLSTSETIWYHIGTAIGVFAFAIAYAAGALGAFIEFIKIFIGYGDKDAFVNIVSKLVAMGDASADMDRLRVAAGKVYDIYESIYKKIQGVIDKLKEWKDFIFGSNEPEAVSSGSSGGGGSTVGGTNSSGGGGSRGFGTDEMSQVGEKWGTNVVQGFADYMAKDETTLQLQTALVSAGDTAQMNATKQTNQIGNFWAGDILSGVISWFSNPTPMGIAMGALPTAISLWRTSTGKTELEKHGDSFGDDITTGLDTKLTNDVGYLPSMILAIAKWITENTQDLLDKGADLGAGLIKGMTDTISGSVESLWKAMSGMLDKLWDKMPDWVKWLWGEDVTPAKERKSEEDKTQKSSENKTRGAQVNKGDSLYNTNGYTPYGKPINEKSGVTININIDPSIAGQIDRKSVKMLAEEVYAMMIKDMKLAGI